jgi:rubrerythrin
VEPETSVLLSLVQVMTAIGSEATIASLVSSEQLTNSTYECSMALGFAKDVNSLLERNYDDEKRHLSTLQRMRQQELGTAAHGRSKGAKPSRPASQT